MAWGEDGCRQTNSCCSAWIRRMGRKRTTLLRRPLAGGCRGRSRCSRTALVLRRRPLINLIHSELGITHDIQPMVSSVRIAIENTAYLDRNAFEALFHERME